MPSLTPASRRRPGWPQLASGPAALVVAGVTALPLITLPLLAVAQGSPAATSTATATAAAVPDRQARVWAASCASCHGTEGRAQGVIPALAGRDATTLLTALNEFRSGQRPAATVMHQHTKGYTEDELRRIASYFASLPAAR